MIPSHTIVYVSQNITSRVTGVFDGWSTRRRRPFMAFLIQFIHSPPENPNAWSLKALLLAFKHTVGRHNGKMIGHELVTISKEYNLEDKVYFQPFQILSKFLYSYSGSLGTMSQLMMWRFGSIVKRLILQRRS